jgi:hypothetical protein
MLDRRELEDDEAEAEPVDNVATIA